MAMVDNLLDDQFVPEVVDELCEYSHQPGTDDDPVREYDVPVCYPIGEFHYLRDSVKCELDQEFCLNDEEIELYFED